MKLAIVICLARVHVCYFSRWGFESYSAKSFSHGNPRKISTSKIERYMVVLTDEVSVICRDVCADTLRPLSDGGVVNEAEPTSSSGQTSWEQPTASFYKAPVRACLVVGCG